MQESEQTKISFDADLMQKHIKSSCTLYLKMETAGTMRIASEKAAITLYKAMYIYKHRRDRNISYI